MILQLQHLYNPPSSDNNELPSKENLQEGNQITQSEPAYYESQLNNNNDNDNNTIQKFNYIQPVKEENIDGVKIQWN